MVTVVDCPDRSFLRLLDGSKSMRFPVMRVLLPVVNDLNELPTDYLGAEFEHLQISIQ